MKLSIWKYFSKLLLKNFHQFQGLNLSYNRPGHFGAIPSICNQRSLSCGFMLNSHMKNLERYLMKRPTCTRCQPSWWSSCLSSTASSVLQPLLEIHSSFTLWLCPGKIAKVYNKHHVQIFNKVEKILERRVN